MCVYDQQKTWLVPLKATKDMSYSDMDIFHAKFEDLKFNPAV